MKTRIVRIGNSQGIRIPKPLLDQTGLCGEVEIDAQETPSSFARRNDRGRAWPPPSRRWPVAATTRCSTTPHPACRVGMRLTGNGNKTLRGLPGESRSDHRQRDLEGSPLPRGIAGRDESCHSYRDRRADDDRGTTVPNACTLSIQKQGWQVVLDQIRTVERTRPITRQGRIDDQTAIAVLEVLEDIFKIYLFNIIICCNLEITQMKLQASHRGLGRLILGSPRSLTSPGATITSRKKLPIQLLEPPTRCTERSALRSHGKGIL